MPAEIDTGGPRVLHCDYRADCPIPIVGSPSRPRSNRTTVAATSTRPTPSDESRADVRPRRRAGRARSSSLRESRRRGQERRDAEQDSDSGEPRFRGESRLRGDLGSSERAEPSQEYRGFREEAEKEHLPIGWSRLSSHRPSDLAVDRSAREAGLALEASYAEQRSIRRTRSRSTSEIEPDATGASARFRAPRKLSRVCPKSRSYFQLALLLFLVAFGQSGLLKSPVLNHSAKPCAAGLSVLAIGTVIGAVSAAPIDLIGDAGVRAERSANLSHITGASRKIQMYIKNRHLQILPDGTVNGSNDDTSDYTIFQRTSVSRGQLRIQGVATCLYLCMDSCGLLYGSREYTEDCVFNETLEQHNYNTYSSVRWSTTKKTLYLGLNRRGQPRRVQVKGHNLGRLSAYARVLTQVAPPDRVEALQRRMLGAQHNVRHRHSARGGGQHHHRGDVIPQPVCPSLPAQEKDGRDRFRCRKRKKRKKRKRRCRAGEKPGPQCQVPEELSGSIELPTTTLGVLEEGRASPDSSESRRSCEGATEGCRQDPLATSPASPRRTRVQEPAVTSDGGGSRHGKSKAAAKKPGVPGSMSQSKKPNLTDGKKRRRKGPPPARRNPSPARKRPPAPGTATSRSAPLTETTERHFITSSSPSQPPGASTGPSAGRGASLRRRKLPASPRNGFQPSDSPPVDDPTRSLAKTLSPKLERDPARFDDSRETSTLVPETTVLDRSEPSSTSEEDPITENTTPDITSVTSLEYTTVPIEAGDEGVDRILESFRLLEEEKSLEDASEEAEENEEDARFDENQGEKRADPRVPIERLAM